MRTAGSIVSTKSLCFRLPYIAPTDEEILEWIFTGPTGNKQQSVSQKRVEDSGEWFLKCPEFQNWVSGESSNLLYCPGKGQ